MGIYNLANKIRSGSFSAIVSIDHPPTFIQKLISICMQNSQGTILINKSNLICWITLMRIVSKTDKAIRKKIEPPEGGWSLECVGVAISDD